MNKSGLMGNAPIKQSGLNSGQVIILVAISMIALLGIIGLAIDGGRLLLLRRDAQNANDAAVLSSVFALCTGGTESQVIAAGESTASANGFTDGDGETTVVVEPNPAGLPSEACAECSVAVTITRQIEPFFIQLVYGGELEVTTYAVGTCTPDSVSILEEVGEVGGDGEIVRPPLAAFWGGATSCNQPPVDIAGSDVVIGGNIHSNADIDLNPSNQAAGGSCVSPGGTVLTLDGGWTFGNITCATCDSGFKDEKSMNCDWNQMPGADVEEPVCGASCATTDTNNGGDGDNDQETVSPYLNDDGSILWPVDYEIQDFRPGTGSVAIQLSATGNYFAVNGDMGADDIPAPYLVGGVLQPGVYYASGDIWIKNGINVGTATFVAEGSIKVTSKMDLKAYYDNLLFFANGPSTPNCIKDGIHVSSSDSAFEGIIFSPNGQTQFSAASNISLNGCIVGLGTKNSASGLRIICEPEDSDTRGTISFQQ